ncbi:hypothetical protein DPMN_110811 [Dreissena polymorpha]|uniref:Uncharacterized protein n=1 Tax=Dreissena polymorpha TaxID=45954 RepID=A0A9D4QP68_DREPO|nr:hypothetical protein DPMN_110811 [Dreissena polymorpha]
MIHLQEISQGRDDNAMKAEGYLKAMTKENFLSFLHFMLDWTKLLSDVSVLFQEKACLIGDVARVLELKDKFAHMKERRGKMSTDSIERLKMEL